MKISITQKQIQIAFLALELVFLTSCDRLPGTAAYLGRSAHDVLSQSLFDPASADYRDLHYGVNDKGVSKDLICGEVNAKNRLGGYTGFKGFLVLRDQKMALVDPGVDMTSNYVSREDRQLQLLYDAAYPSACKKAAS